MEYRKLCAAKDIPLGGMHQCDLEAKEFLVVNLDNQFYCLDARCTHAGAPLVEGKLNGDVLTCPWHFALFNVTNGSVVGGPAKKPLNTYKVIIKDEQLFIDSTAV
jgi:nitrite reductase/ring-hydroxylating ferredoxin subunit